MEANPQVLEDQYLTQELAQISDSPQKGPISLQNYSVWTNILTPLDPLSDPNKHRFNHYADKQLTHLVVAEEFDFAKIASTLNYIFREERLKFSEAACRQRWQELHTLRALGAGVKEKRMEDKRASSVSAFSDPYSLYNLEEMVQRLKKNQTQYQVNGSSQPNYQGYNIFKNSIRHIDDLQGHKKREQQMLHALNQAQSKAVTDKLMHFEPYYERLNQFEVHQEELTEEKMKQIMSRPIDVERLEKQLRVMDMNEEGSWKNKRTRREEERIEQDEHNYDIEEDWDEYESD